MPILDATRGHTSVTSTKAHRAFLLLIKLGFGLASFGFGVSGRLAQRVIKI